MRNPSMAIGDWPDRVDGLRTNQGRAPYKNVDLRCRNSTLSGGGFKAANWDEALTLAVSSCR